MQKEDNELTCKQKEKKQISLFAKIEKHFILKTY